MTTIERDEQYIAHTYGRFPIEITHGKGAHLFDETGKDYIDLGSGIAVNTFGAADEGWKQAVIAQMDRIGHTSNLYYTEPGTKLAEMLCERTGMKRVFFSNSGAEANECAIKAARRYAFQTYGDESHNTIITLRDSFHGRTLTTLSATGQDVFHQEFGPFTPGFLYATANDIDDVRRLAEENDCCAIMFEVVQGEGGVRPLTKAFAEGLQKLAAEKHLLLIADEVQTGNGRSGQLYGYMNYGLHPDIVTTAKGLAGGLPLGATLLGERVRDVFTPGSHGSTFGGNPICCAAALYVLGRIDEPLLSGVRAKAEMIRRELAHAKGVVSVDGLGLMIGIETEKPAKEVIAGCMERGVLVLSAKQKVRLLPPLTIPDEDLMKALTILKEVLSL